MTRPYAISSLAFLVSESRALNMKCSADQWTLPQTEATIAWKIDGTLRDQLSYLPLGTSSKYRQFCGYWQGKAKDGPQKNQEVAWTPAGEYIGGEFRRFELPEALDVEKFSEQLKVALQASADRRILAVEGDLDFRKISPSKPIGPSNPEVEVEVNTLDEKNEVKRMKVFINPETPVNIAQGGMNGGGKGSFFLEHLAERLELNHKLKIPNPKEKELWFNPQLDLDLQIASASFLNELWEHCGTIADANKRFATYWAIKNRLWAPGSPVRAPMDAYNINAKNRQNCLTKHKHLSKWTETTWASHMLALGLLPGLSPTVLEPNTTNPSGEELLTAKMKTAIEEHPLMGYNKVFVVYKTDKADTVMAAAKLATARMANELAHKTVLGGVNVTFASLDAINTSAKDVTLPKLEYLAAYHNKVAQAYNQDKKSAERMGYAFVEVIDMDKDKVIQPTWVAEAAEDWKSYEAGQLHKKEKYYNSMEQSRVSPAQHAFITAAGEQAAISAVCGRVELVDGELEQVEKTKVDKEALMDRDDLPDFMLNHPKFKAGLETALVEFLTKRGLLNL